MRRVHRKPYYPPPLHLSKKKQKDKPSKPLVQPEWDDTIHDLNPLKASPDDLLKRKLSRTSHNQMGIALVTQLRRSARSGQQDRYTPSASDGDASDTDSEPACTSPHSQQQQQHGSAWHQQQSPPRGQQQQVGLRQQQEQQRRQQLQQQHQPWQGQRQQHQQWREQERKQNQQGQGQGQQPLQQQQEAASRSTSALAQHACSTADSEEDVCQWQSPIRPTNQQQQQQQHEGWPRVQDVRGSRQQESTAAGLTELTAAAIQHLQELEQQQHAEAHKQHGGRLSVDADALQLLLNKINLLETQLGQRNLQEQQHEQPQRSAPGLQQQLAASQQQLQATQQELRVLRDEHRQYVAHTSTLLTQLQTQVQQVLTGQHMMPPPLPSLQLQVQQHQQQPMSLPGYSSRLRPAPVGGQQGIHGAAAGGGAAVGVAGAAAAAAIEKGMRDNSTDRLLQISSFIRQQLHEQEQGAAAQPGLSDSTSSKAPGIWPAGNRSGSNSMQQQQQPPAYAAAEANTGWTSTSPSKPLTAAAAGGEAVGPGAGSTQACSSPSRRKAALLFTPAVADSVPLPSYAAMRQQGRGVMGSPAAAGDPLSQQQAVLGTAPSSPSRGWRGQDRGSHAAGEAAGSMGAFGSPSSGWKGQDRGTQSAAAEAAGSPSRGWRGQGTSNGDPRASVGSPQRLHAAQIPQLLPMHGPTGRGLAGPQQQHRPAGNADGSNSTGMEPPRALSSLRVPPAAAAAAAVWQAELASSPRPQQMQVPQEATHAALLSNAAGEYVMRLGPHQQSQLPSDLTALLQDLGLASLEFDHAPSFPANPTQPPAASYNTSAHQRMDRMAAGAGGGVQVVLSEAAAAPAAVTAQGLLGLSRGDGLLGGMEDVDRGLQEGLSRAAVSRVFTAAGCVVEEKGGGGVGGAGTPQPFVLADLKNNMCFRDHLRAAGTGAAASGGRVE